MAEETTNKVNLQLNLPEPRATEKAYLEQTNRIYVFPVKRSMSKQAIAKMVEKEFNVTVTDVRTLIRNVRRRSIVRVSTLILALRIVKIRSTHTYVSRRVIR